MLQLNRVLPTENRDKGNRKVAEGITEETILCSLPHREKLKVEAVWSEIILRDLCETAVMNSQIMIFQSTS